jgi:NAD(P)-dependent dehydrogenase (short-subunit alcohol dehydrogenase family)
MKTIALFGGSGGLGTQLAPLLEQKYNVVSISSKDVDITEIDKVTKFFSENDIDILINLSGYNYDSFIHKIDIEKKWPQITDLVGINIYGTLNLLAEALQKMREKKYGRIILISSVLVEKPTLGTGLYSASKAFIDNLVKTVSLENISKGITCNSLQLGYFDGGMAHRLPENVVEPIKNSIGLKRWGTIQELYQTVDFLIETEYITGQNINISGGLC